MVISEKKEEEFNITDDNILADIWNHCSDDNIKPEEIPTHKNIFYHHRHVGTYTGKTIENLPTIKGEYIYNIDNANERLNKYNSPTPFNMYIYLDTMEIHEKPSKGNYVKFEPWNKDIPIMQYQKNILTELIENRKEIEKIETYYEAREIINKLLRENKPPIPEVNYAIKDIIIEESNIKIYTNRGPIITDFNKVDTDKIKEINYYIKEYNDKYYMNLDNENLEFRMSYECQISDHQKDELSDIGLNEQEINNIKSRKHADTIINHKRTEIRPPEFGIIYEIMNIDINHDNWIYIYTNIQTIIRPITDENVRTNIIKIQKLIQDGNPHRGYLKADGSFKIKENNSDIWAGGKMRYRNGHFVYEDIYLSGYIVAQIKHGQLITKYPSNIRIFGINHPQGFIYNSHKIIGDMPIEEIDVTKETDIAKDYSLFDF